MSTVNRRRHRLIRFGTGAAWSSHQIALAAAGSAGAFVYLVALDQASGGFDPVFWALGFVPAFLLRLNASGAPLAYWALMLLRCLQALGSASTVALGTFSSASLVDNTETNQGYL